MSKAQLPFPIHAIQEKTGFVLQQILDAIALLLKIHVGYGPAVLQLILEIKIEHGADGEEGSEHGTGQEQKAPAAPGLSFGRFITHGFLVSVSWSGF
jgi:hypothetical protein